VNQSEANGGAVDDKKGGEELYVGAEWRWWDVSGYGIRDEGLFRNVKRIGIGKIE
jgi:hypothetical protein